jgi:hypothetical protein
MVRERERESSEDFFGTVSQINKVATLNRRIDSTVLKEER